MSPGFLQTREEAKSAEVRTRLCLLTLLPKQPEAWEAKAAPVAKAAVLCCSLFSWEIRGGISKPQQKPTSHLECRCHLHSKCHLKLTPEGACWYNSARSGNSSLAALFPHICVYIKICIYLKLHLDCERFSSDDIRVPSSRLQQSNLLCGTSPITCHNPDKF